MAQKPNRLYTQALGNKRVNRITIPMPNTISPDNMNSLSRAVLENNFAGVKAAMLMRRSLKYIKIYQTALSNRYTTIYIFKPNGNDC